MGKVLMDSELLELIKKAVDLQPSARSRQKVIDRWMIRFSEEDKLELLAAVVKVKPDAKDA